MAHRGPQIQIGPCSDEFWPAAERLLVEVFIAEGFPLGHSAGEMYRRDRLETAGMVLCAAESELLLGVVVLLHSGSPLAQVARDGEAEFRMLAVSRAARGRGIGAMLVRECIRRAAGPPLSASALVLWTQPGMRAAQRLYERLGFQRMVERDAVLPPPSAGADGVSLERWAYRREL